MPLFENIFSCKESREIRDDLRNLKGKSADYCTSTYKGIGDGNMGDGSARIANQWEKDIKVATAKGLSSGLLAASPFIIYWFKCKVIAYRQHKKEEKELLAKMKQSMKDAENMEKERAQIVETSETEVGDLSTD